MSLTGTLLLLITLSAANVGAAAADIDAWTSIGPSGGAVTALAADPSNQNVVYVGTRGGIFKSTVWRALRLNRFALLRFGRLLREGRGHEQGQY